jgi:hypothetical protein
MKRQSLIAGIALVVAVLALVLVVLLALHSGKSLGGERAGLQEFIDGIKSGDLPSKYVSKKLEPQQNSVKLYCNTSGRDVIADYGSVVIPTGETASSSANVSLFASSSPSIPATQDFAALAEGRRALIQTVGIATSTTASTTNSTLAAVQAKGNGAVLVANNSCLYGYLQQNTTGCSIAGAAAGVCETATSTNRGTNPIFNVRIHGVSSGATSL